MIFEHKNMPLDPSNFELKLIDFGAARTTNSHKTQEALNSAVINQFAVMTFELCSPEQTFVKRNGDTYYVEVK
jgi:serine/threonine protein kinase